MYNNLGLDMIFFVECINSESDEYCDDVKIEGDCGDPYYLESCRKTCDSCDLGKFLFYNSFYSFFIFI